MAFEEEIGGNEQRWGRGAPTGIWTPIWVLFREQFRDTAGCVNSMHAYTTLPLVCRRCITAAASVPV